MNKLISFIKAPFLIIWNAIMVYMSFIVWLDEHIQIIIRYIINIFESMRGLDKKIYDFFYSGRNFHRTKKIYKVVIYYSGIIVNHVLNYSIMYIPPIINIAIRYLITLVILIYNIIYFIIYNIIYKTIFDVFLSKKYNYPNIIHECLQSNELNGSLQYPNSIQSKTIKDETYKLNKEVFTLIKLLKKKEYFLKSNNKSKMVEYINKSVQYIDKELSKKYKPKFKVDNSVDIYNNPLFRAKSNNIIVNDILKLRISNNDK